MTTTSARPFVSQHGRAIEGAGECRDCHQKGLVWVVRELGPPLLVHPSDDTKHAERCAGPRPLVVRPAFNVHSEAEALHAAHVIRDYVVANRKAWSGDLRAAADRLHSDAVVWVANMPPGDANCPICQLPFRDVKRG